MEEDKSQNNYSYSQDYNTMTAFQHEINNLTINKNNDNIRPVVEEYLRNRVKEIKDRWK